MIQIKLVEKCHFLIVKFYRNRPTETIHRIHRRIPDSALCSNKATSMNVPMLPNSSPISFPFYDPSLQGKTTGTQQSGSVPAFFSLLTSCKLIFSRAWSCPPGKPETSWQLLTHFRMGFSESKINVSVMLWYYAACSRGAKSINSIHCSCSSIGRIASASKREPTHKIKQQQQR